ncbi:FtsX-like permease family protein [Enterococcus sp. 2201sp1_2201st1_B8_2201SCRN_220225]|uniref:FtsX-like permease family protein n=1 Tax=unclassified Enterococcus TaxID=2608891 RepID=UPI0034A3AF2A
MTGIIHALASLNYHRSFLYRYLGLLVIFLPLIFLITTLKTVVSKTGAGLSEAMNQGKLPLVDQKWLDNLLHNLYGIVPFYNFALFLCSTLFAIALAFLSYRYCRQRKQEFATCQRLGIPPRKIILHLFVEFFLPLISCLVALFLFMIVFQRGTETVIQNLQSVLIEKFTSVKAMATEAGTVQSGEANAPLMLQLPRNGLLLVDSFQLNREHWVTVALISLLDTSLLLSLVLLATLPLSLLICKRRLKK